MLGGGGGGGMEGIYERGVIYVHVVSRSLSLT